MLIDHFNLNHLRIFECVYRTRSMTAAARELHLTQSGVSQHIKSLEDVLGFKLFDRIQQRLIPTAQAALLFRKCTESLQGLEQILSEIKGGEQKLSGTISIGLPIEFGNNVILPLLSEFGRQHPQVKFALRYGFATSMNERLLRGDLDFAFIDEFGLDKRIHTEKVYDENLILCAHAEEIRKRGLVKESLKYFESLDYVDYQAGEPVLRMWFEHHLGNKNLDLNVRVTVMDVQGVARLILSGFCVGVLPGYLVSKLEKEGTQLHCFKGCGEPLKNGIRLAYLRGKTHSLATTALLKFFHESLYQETTTRKPGLTTRPLRGPRRISCHST